jgi:hypothetical protein
MIKQNAQLLENIFTELISVYENLKAEVVIAEIQEKSKLSSEDFVIANKSTFSRPYRRDIISVDNLLNEDKITFNLSRNGIYDTLPEGLFHVPKGNQDANAYISRRKIVKQEEQDARAFFAPFENEFFYQKLNVENRERELLDNFYNLNDDFLIDFWQIDREIPKDYILKLIKLLPFSHEISGNFELTRLCLQEILSEEVLFKRKYENELNKEDKNKKVKRRNGFQLGVDSVLETKKSMVLSPKLEVTIGPISEKKINNYLKKDGVLKFINTFYDYFVPMEIEVSTKFVVSNDNGFVLDDSNGVIMGISTEI